MRRKVGVDELAGDGEVEFVDADQAPADQPDGTGVAAPDPAIVATANIGDGSDTIPIPAEFGSIGLSDPVGDPKPSLDILSPGTIPPSFGSVGFSDPINPPDQKPLRDMIDPSVNAIAEARAAGQWYLDNTNPLEFDLNVAEVWRDYSGRGVRLAVYDVGVEGTHHDLDGNYLGGPTLTSGTRTYDPGPEAGDNHATSVAGIIASERDGTGTVGVAFNAKFFSVDVGEGMTSTNPDVVLDLAALTQEMDRYDIVNNSWSNYEPFLEGINGLSWASGLHDAVVNGRGGLGTIVVKSGGNARIQSGPSGGAVSVAMADDGNTSLFTNSRYTLDVANVDRNGNIDPTSTPGANLLVSAFGTNIVTTDRIGSMNGYPASATLGADYTDNFGGTSAATPMVSGIVALMLEANPNLGWRDVQTNLAYSARHVGSAVGAAPAGNEDYPWIYNGDVNWNGGGVQF